MIKPRGMTVVELMVALGIMLVVLTLGFPLFYELEARLRADLAINQLHGAMNYARSEAIKRGRAVILCPSKDGLTCGKEWSSGQLIYASSTRGFQGSESAERLRVYSGLTHGGHLSWRGFAGAQVMVWTPSGMQGWQNGTLVYCPADNDPRFARALVVNKAGRVRATSGAGFC